MYSNDDIQIVVNPQPQDDILIKPNLPNYVENYSDLQGLPKINGVTVIDDLTLDELGVQPLGEYVEETEIAAVAKSGSYSDLCDCPVSLSSFTNDCGYLTEHQDISDKQDKLIAGENITIENNVISSTGGGGGGTSKTKLSQFTDDLGSSPVHTHSQYLTEHQSLSAYALKSELPTKTSQLTNDSGFLTQHQDISGKQDISTLETDVKEFINEEYILSFIQDGTEISY